MRVIPPTALSLTLFSSKHCIISSLHQPLRLHYLRGAERAGAGAGAETSRRCFNSLRLSPSRTHAVGERPPDPETLTESVADNVQMLKKWFEGKRSILCLTGAGISTDSGIPDYRGANGSYHKGHKPMVHDEFMRSHKMRQRYWGRAMIGWRDFAAASPNEGHLALAELEKMGRIGVTFDDSSEFYKPNCENAELNWAYTPGYQKMSIITQNVDGLHRKAGSDPRHVTNLHGRNDRLTCMSCGSYHCRHDFHNQLDELNSDWVEDQQVGMGQDREGRRKQLRADGDAVVKREVYDEVQVPSCPHCDADDHPPGFFKPDVVFFGDSVPKYRVNRCYAAVDAADGLLCIGSSLAVHSAYRFVQHAASQGIPIAILNVGDTRAEVSGLDLLKIEAPAGPTLSELVKAFKVRP